MLCDTNTTACSRTKTVTFTHVGGRFLVSFSFTAFISVPGVPAGFSANQKADTPDLEKLMSCQYHFSAPYLLLFSSVPDPCLFQVICSLACSFPAINSSIKDTTSKSQLRGLCLPAFVRDGNRRRKKARRSLPLLLLHSLPSPPSQFLPVLVPPYRQQ